MVIILLQVTALVTSTCIDTYTVQLVPKIRPFPHFFHYTIYYTPYFIGITSSLIGQYLLHSLEPPSNKIVTYMPVCMMSLLYM